MAERRRIVITGVGVCCNMGDNLPTIEEHLRLGRGAPFVRWQPAVDHGARCQLLGEYNGDVSDAALGIGKKESRFMGRASRLALKAARAAIAQSGVDVPPCGLVVGCGAGDANAHIEIQAKLDRYPGTKRVGPVVIPKVMASTVSANLVNVLRTVGPSFSATAACAGGNYNLLLAAQLIEAGFMDSAIAGGVEAVDMHFYAGFDAMGAYNQQDNDTPERASRPYAADRAGFIFGEGAGILVLEAEETARARGAKVLGIIEGYGMSSDGQGQMVAPAATGAAAALRSALRHSGLRPEDIDYVNTHGTSTPLGDISEVKAMRDVFGDHRVAYSSTKGYTGHTISAAGAIEAIFTLAMLRGSWIAPSVHAEPLDPEIESFPPIVRPEERPLRHAISSSFGFGGTNAAVVLGPPPR